MLSVSVIRLFGCIFVLLLTFVLCSSQKAFLKGLLIGSLLGHGKKSLLHDKEFKGHGKDVHHYEPQGKEYVPMPVQKEFVPVPIHDEPHYIPIYIVKDCPFKKGYSSLPASIPDHIHDHNHNYLFDESNNYEQKDMDYGSNYKESYDSRESRDIRVRKSAKNSDNNEDDNESNDNTVNISIKAQKGFAN